MEGALTATEQLHDQPQLILYHERGVVRHNIGVVALAHGLNLFLREEKQKQRHNPVNQRCTKQLDNLMAAWLFICHPPDRARVIC